MHALDLFPDLFGYVGIGAGAEFIPYFVALLSLVGAALIAVLQWPVAVVVSRLSARHRSSAKTDADASRRCDADINEMHSSKSCGVV
jgi:hypothetical protein